jgi:hypothetical protein
VFSKRHNLRGYNKRKNIFIFYKVISVRDDTRRERR